MQMMSGSTVFLPFVLLVVSGVCTGHYYRLTDCPKVSVKRDFEMDKFLGDWYVAARYNPLSTCTRMHLWKNEEGDYAFNETSRFLGFNFRWDSLHNNKNNARGRKLTILSNDTDAIFKVQNSFGVNTFGVIDTDYDNFAVVWGCDPAILGSLQNLDILSRTPEIEKSLLKEKIQDVDKMGIEVKLIERVDQRYCSPAQKNNGEAQSSDEGINNMFVEKE